MLAIPGLLAFAPGAGARLLLPAADSPSPLAASLAKKVDSHYNSLHSLAADFVQSFDGMGMHRVERGTLLLAKAGRFGEGKMRWIYAQPAGKLFVLDGKQAYFYTPGQTEVQRLPARQLGSGADTSDLRSPLALLLGHADLAKQLSGLTLTPAGGGDATLSGMPRGLEQRVARLSVTASPDGVIRELVVEEVDGARTSFQFSSEQDNVPAPASAFVFKPPPGTHVVEGTPPV